MAPELESRRCAAACVYWPSKRFADREVTPSGGAAGMAASNLALKRTLDRLDEDPVRLGGHTAGDSDADRERHAHIRHARALIPELESSTAARVEFARAIRATLGATEAHHDDGSAEFLSLAPEDLFTRLAPPVAAVMAPGSGGAAAVAAGGAASVQDLVSGASGAARRIANFATYYQMKTRAGLVGRLGLGPAIARVRDRRPDVSLHLVGHSFGARVITAAASTLAPDSLSISLTLLQGAYSHNGLSSRFDGTHDGEFRTVLSEHRISGPVLITHTKNDAAVGVAYPLASRIARDVASALGDQNDPYGGMGRNGAQHTPESVAEELRDVGERYTFAPGRVYNLRADRFIKDHGDVRGPQVAYACARAMAAAPR